MSDQPLEGQADLFTELGAVTVHCFFQRWCAHTIIHDDPITAHRLMEDHYTEKHYGKHLETVRADVGKAPPWRSTAQP